MTTNFQPSPDKVIAAVAHRGDRLPLPPVSVACPRPFLELIVRCWAQVPDHRPSFGEIVACLEAMPQVMPEGDVTPDAPQGGERTFDLTHLIGTV